MDFKALKSQVTADIKAFLPKGWKASVSAKSSDKSLTVTLTTDFLLAERVNFPLFMVIDNDRYMEISKDEERSFYNRPRDPDSRRKDVNPLFDYTSTLQAIWDCMVKQQDGERDIEHDYSWYNFYPELVVKSPKSLIEQCEWDRKVFTANQLNENEPSELEVHYEKD